MGRLASAFDFEDDGSGKGALYSQYADFAFFSSRAAWIASKWSGKKVAIAGSGWGYLILHMRLEQSWPTADVHGFDASPYALGKLAVVNNHQVDALSATEVETLRANIMPGPKKFDVVVTEELLPVLSDAECLTALTNLRALGTEVAHIITCPPASEFPLSSVRRDLTLNWKTIEDWKAFIGNGETVWNAEAPFQEL